MSIFVSPGIFAYSCFLLAILGAALGSFLNCAAWRIAHGENVLRGRSHCPSCGHTLGATDLVPILSWCFLRGRCRYCGEKVSARYPLTELFFALVTMVCFLKGDLRILTLRNWLFICCLFCLSLVDLECYIIPNGCLLLSALFWAAALPFAGMNWKEIGMHILAGIVVSGIILFLSIMMDRFLNRESMGGGDIKLFAVVGLYLGFAGSLFAVILACIIGLIFALVRRLLPGNRAVQIPFGPSIAASTAVILLFGEPVIAWYIQLLRSV